MLACWAFQPEDRPTFSWILQRLLTLKEVAELNSDAPFPPTFRGAINHGFTKAEHSGGAEAGSRSGSGEVQISTTPGSARFQRNIPPTGSLKSVPKRRRKIPGFRSFRKAKAASSPQPPPSKDDLERSISPSRPVSGASSGLESYTTSRLSYEVPLLKNVIDETRRASLQPTSDYVSASSAGSLQRRSLSPRSLYGADNLAFEPTSPKGGENVLPLHDYMAQTAGASSTQNQYVPSPAMRKPKRTAPAAPSFYNTENAGSPPSPQRNTRPRSTRTSDV